MAFPRAHFRPHPSKRCVHHGRTHFALIGRMGIKIYDSIWAWILTVAINYWQTCAEEGRRPELRSGHVPARKHCKKHTPPKREARPHVLKKTT